MSENKCPKCGASIPENKQYCPHCGARLSLSIEAPKIIEEKAKPKKELSPKTKKILKNVGVDAAAFAVIGTTIGLLTPLVFVPNAQISEVKKGNIFSFNEIGDSYSVRANTSLKKYFHDYLPSEITIPSEYKGHPVTEIESFGFMSCYLTSITIPDSVTSIKEYAFRGCSSLESIIIPDSVTSIGEGTFYNCSSLESIIIPDSVTSIGEGAFYECVNLDKVFFAGSEAEWYSISIDSGNGYLEYNVYYYSEEEPTGSENYWHYVDGVPTIWLN